MDRAGVTRAGPEVGLRTCHHPIEVHRTDVRGHVLRDPREPRQARLASVLHSAAAVTNDLDLKLQREILRVDVTIDEVIVAAGILRRRFADDRTVFDAPEFWIAVPPLEAHSIKQGHITLVVVEVDRTWLSEVHAAAAATGRRPLCWCGRGL